MSQKSSSAKALEANQEKGKCVKCGKETENCYSCNAYGYEEQKGFLCTRCVLAKTVKWERIIAIVSAIISIVPLFILIDDPNEETGWLIFLPCLLLSIITFFTSTSLNRKIKKDKYVAGLQAVTMISALLPKIKKTAVETPIDDNAFVRQCVEKLKRTNNKAEIIAIGQKLHDRGYVPLMREAHSLFIKEHGDYSFMSLEYIWDGIGYWHA